MSCINLLSSSGVGESYRPDDILPGIFRGNSFHKNIDIQFQMVCASIPLMVKRVGLKSQTNPGNLGKMGRLVIGPGDVGTRASVDANRITSGDKGRNIDDSPGLHFYFFSYTCSSISTDGSF